MLTFNGLPIVGKSTFSRQVEVNICDWLSWSLLHADSFININGDENSPIPQMKLKPVIVPGYATRRCWESRRSSWIWEGQDVDRPIKPISPSIFLVQNGSISLASTSTYNIDYPSGRVVFNYPVETGTEVLAKYSHRFHQVYDSSHPFSYRVDSLSLKYDDPRWLQESGLGGDLEVLAKDRIQLPALCVAPQGGFKHKAYELGSSTNEVWEDFRILCLAETKPDLIWIKDVLCSQVSCSISTFNLDTTFAPLNQQGFLSPTAKTYAELCAEAPWKTITIENVSSGDYNKVGFLYWIPVFYTIRIGVI